MNFTTLYNILPLWKRISLTRVYQNATYHPEIWVDKHIEQVFDNVVDFWGDDLDLMICAIFHDITKDEQWQKRVIPKFKGKDSQMDLFKLKLSNIGHDKTAIKYINKWKHLYSNYDINWDKVEQVCDYHLRAHQYITGDLKKKSKRKKFEDLEFFEDILRFESCDAYNPLKTIKLPSVKIKKQDGKVIKIKRRIIYNWLLGKNKLKLI